MSKKILISVAPLFAVAAFAMTATAAQARTTYGTETGGVFTAFTKAEKVLSQKVPTSGNLKLKAASGAVIECTNENDIGTVENVSSVGHSATTLVFEDCTTTAFEGKVCDVGSALSSDNITGTVTDKVKAETEVEVTVTGGFKLQFTGAPAGCLPEGTEIGKVTGSIIGTQAKKTNVLVFSATKGLKLNTEETELTGEVETVLESNGAKVVI